MKDMQEHTIYGCLARTCGTSSWWQSSTCILDTGTKIRHNTRFGRGISILGHLAVFGGAYKHVSILQNPQKIVTTKQTFVLCSENSSQNGAGCRGWIRGPLADQSRILIYVVESAFPEFWISSANQDDVAFVVDLISIPNIAVS